MKIEKYKKNNKTFYRFQIRLGSKVTRRSNFKTKAEAIFEYTRMVEDYEDGISGNITYNEMFEKWDKFYKTTVKESTYYRNYRKFQNYVLPVFGEKKLDEITVDDCQEFIVSLSHLVEGRTIYNQAKRVMRYAVKSKFVRENPFNNVEIPKFKEEVERIDFLTVREVNILLDYIKDDIYWYTMFRIFIYVGLRRGELLALTWDDIDFDKKTININKTATIGINYKVKIAPPKTKASIAVLPLDDFTVLSLKKLKLQSKYDLIFPNTTGGIKRLSDPADKLKWIIKKTGIKDIRLHDLRHTTASLMFSSGANMKKVQERLRHADIRTTMNIYTHVSKEDSVDVVANFADYIDNYKGVAKM